MSDLPPSGGPAALRADIERLLGEGVVLADPERTAPYLSEWRGVWRGTSPFVLRPRSTAEVAAVVRLAGSHRVPLVPQAGNTGLVGGQVPRADGSEVVVSTDRLDDIGAVDVEGGTLVVGAGAILASVHAAAEAAGFVFPVNLGARGSARIGGMVSTNAGGIGVLAYGSMRDRVLGLEVVLPDGRVWDGLRALKKDNTGYDLKHLFIGAEGTLGIVTRAVLRLAPRPASLDVAVAAVADPAAAVALLRRLRAALGEALTACELVPRFAAELVDEVAGVKAPFDEVPAWMLLAEAATMRPERPMRDVLEETLAAAIEDGLASDALVAQSLAEAAEFWAVREAIAEIAGKLGPTARHDVSVTVARVPACIADAMAAATRAAPGCRPLAFGHVGDGNIHFNVLAAPGAADFPAAEAVTAAVHGAAIAHRGSIAAEHGVGRLKAHLVPTTRGAVELDMMRAVKAMLDPLGIMNPGRVLPSG